MLTEFNKDSLNQRKPRFLDRNRRAGLQKVEKIRNELDKSTTSSTSSSSSSSTTSLIAASKSASILMTDLPSTRSNADAMTVSSSSSTATKDTKDLTINKCTSTTTTSNSSSQLLSAAKLTHRNSTRTVFGGNNSGGGGGGSGNGGVDNNSTKRAIISSGEGCNDIENFLLNDNDEIKIICSQGEHICTVKKNLTFFRLDSVRRAKACHKAITKRKYKSFQNFNQKWLKANVSELLQQSCTDWLLGKTNNELIAAQVGNAITNNITTRTKVILQNDLQKTPYHCFNRYKVTPMGICASGSAAITNLINLPTNVGSGSSNNNASGDKNTITQDQVIAATNLLHCNKLNVGTINNTTAGVHTGATGANANDLQAIHPLET